MAREREVGHGDLYQAFIGRLPPLQDLSAHHASTDKSVPETGHGTGESFREGMEGDERQRELRPLRATLTLLG